MVVLAYFISLFACNVVEWICNNKCKLSDSYANKYLSRIISITKQMTFVSKQRARSIQPKFRPVRPVGPNRSIEFWTEISGNFNLVEWIAPKVTVSLARVLSHNCKMVYWHERCCRSLLSRCRRNFLCEEGWRIERRRNKTSSFNKQPLLLLWDVDVLRG